MPRKWYNGLTSVEIAADQLAKEERTEKLRAEGCKHCKFNTDEILNIVICARKVPNKYRGDCRKFRVK